MARQFAVVTGASTGIGYELARCCAAEGFDLLIAADEPRIHDVAREPRQHGVDVTAVETDLATDVGVDELYEAMQDRQVDLLLANAGRGFGGAFLDQDFSDVTDVVATNVMGTLYLIHRVGRDMRYRGAGRILITGSMAGFVPATYQAVYNGTKAFLDAFSCALRAELRGSGVTVTCLMPGATETDFFDRTDMLDARNGRHKEADPAEVARQGFDAMMRGDGDIVPGWMNKLRSAIALVTPWSILADQHGTVAETDSARRAG
jgi:short-subunit dehydrogenase